MNRIRSGVLALTGLLAACSGGATTPNGALPPARQKPPKQAPALAHATFSIVIPLSGRTVSSRGRTPQYFSPNTQSFTVTVTSNNGQPINNPQAQTINTGAGLPNCTSTSSTLTCTGVVDAPVGTDVFSVTATSRGNGTGATLSLGNVTAQISPTAANNVPITLNGVVAAVKVAFPTDQPAPGSSQTIPVTVTAFDCTGATIVGPGSYSTPITLANGDKSGSTVLSTTSVNAPSDVVTLAWDGSSSLQYAAVTGTVPLNSVPCQNPLNNQPPGIQFQTGFFLPHPEPPYLWTASASSSGSIGPYGWLVAYPLAWLRDGGTSVRPGPVIITPGTELAHFVGVDHAGNVYANFVDGNNVPGIFKFAPGATFAAQPATTIPYSSFKPADGAPNNTYPAAIVDLNVDQAGNIFIVRGGYVTNRSTNANADLLELTAPSYSSAVGVYHDQNNNVLNRPIGLGVDASDNSFVANGPSDNPPAPSYLFEYPAAKGFALPNDANGRAVGYGFGFDATGNVYVPIAQGSSRSVAIYPRTSFASGSGTQSGGFSFAASYLNGGSDFSQNAIGVDTQGYVYVNGFYGQISVFAPGASGSVKPLTSFQCCYDPTTLDSKIAVPAGLVPPPNSASSIAMQQ